MARSYTTALVDESYRVTAKRPIVVVDLRSTEEQAADLRAAYHFLHREHTEWYLDGFSQAAVDRLFQSPSYVPPERR